MQWDCKFIARGHNKFSHAIPNYFLPVIAYELKEDINHFAKLPERNKHIFSRNIKLLFYLNFYNFLLFHYYFTIMMAMI